MSDVWVHAITGPNGRSEVDVSKINTEAAAAEFDANAEVADDEFPTMEEAVMLSRGIRTSINKSSTGLYGVVYTCVFSLSIWYCLGGTVVQSVGHQICDKDGEGLSPIWAPLHSDLRQALCLCRQQFQLVRV